MHGAVKRITKPPNRYNPSISLSVSILPLTDFDLTMSPNNSINCSLSSTTPVTLESLSIKIQDICDTFAQQMDNVSCKFGELDNKLEILGMQLHDIYTDTTDKLSQMKTEAYKDYEASEYAHL